MSDLILLFFVSTVANIFSALAGGGAGLLQFPVLLFLGLPYPVALATHKIASVALGVGATTRHLQSGALNWRLSLFLLGCGVPGVLLGAVTVLDIPETWAKPALGVLMLALGLYSIFSPNLGQQTESRNRNVFGYVVGGLGLFFIGFLNGSLTAGTGLFVTMLMVRWFGLDYRLAVAHTLVLVGLAWNGSGAAVLTVIGEVRWDWLPALLAGSLIGGYVGAHLSIVKGNLWIKRSYESVTLLIGVRLLLTAFGI